MNHISREDALPFPIVVYPPSNGFIGFKNTRDDDLWYCECTRTAVQNALNAERKYLEQSSQPVTTQNIVEDIFPEETVERVKNADTDSVDGIIDELRFNSNICHICHGVTPDPPMAISDTRESGFHGTYGWYVNQKQFEYGFPTKTLDLTIMTESFINQLPDEAIEVIDDEVIENISKKYDQFTHLDRKRRQRERTIGALEREEERELRHTRRDNDMSIEEIRARADDIYDKYDYDQVLCDEEQEELTQLRAELNENQKRAGVAAENEVREAFGHRERGSQWVHETILYQLIETMYGDKYTLRRHHRPEWLEGLELDIFIVEAQVGVEYQGEQHYEPIEHWGGEEALQEQQERDQRTRELCEKHGVELVEVRHDEQLSQELVTKRVGSVLED